MCCTYIAQITTSKWLEQILKPHFDDLLERESRKKIKTKGQSHLARDEGKWPDKKNQTTP